MRYRCPKCNRYGMQWDARAKVLVCYYSTCNYVIRMNNHQDIPRTKQIISAIKKEAKEIQHKNIDNIIPIA